MSRNKRPLDGAVIMQMCPSAKRAFGVTTYKLDDGDWWRAWAFPIDPRRARNEGYDKTPVRGNLNATEDFPGCPHCGSGGFVQCGHCRRISCWNEERSMTCPWCSYRMENITLATEEFQLSGGDD